MSARSLTVFFIQRFIKLCLLYILAICDIRSVDCYAVTDDSGQTIRPETMRNILQERIAQLHGVASFESLYIYLEESQTN